MTAEPQAGPVWPVTAEEQAWVLAAVVRHSTDFIAWHGAFQEAWVNPAAAAMAGGIDPSAPLPSRVRDLFEPDSAKLVETVGVPTMNETGSWRAELKIRHRETGEVRDVDFSMFLVRDADGQILGSAGTGRDITDRNRTLAELARARTEAEASNLILAQEEERQRIAAEIHDDSLQALTAVSLRLQLLAQRVTDDEETASMLRDVEAVTADAVARLRRLMFELYPPSLEREGLASAIRLYLTETFGPLGLAWTLSDGLESEPGRAIDSLAYRLTREALTNVVKHAGAATVRVELENRDGGLAVTVTDDGVGFDVDRAGLGTPGHLGLRSMRAMAVSAGGWFRIDSRPGAGTAASLWLPARPGQASVRPL